MSAVPAKRERHTLILADGSKVEATMMGDEILHYFQTDDGHLLQCDSCGIAYYVEAEKLRTNWLNKAKKRQTFRAKKREKTLGRQHTREGTTYSKRGLVILVQFPDVPFHYDQATFERFFNETGYEDDINHGSIHDYFYDASYGKFNLHCDVIGPVTTSHPLSYYGGNNRNGDDTYPATMVAEVVKKIDGQVDFKKYDWDEDGEVENIYLIHSGYDEAQSGRRSDIWSHAWTLSKAKDEGDGDGAIILDGAIIDSYATSAELRDGSGNAITGIGTTCHEFAHCLGLPDFYDTIGYSYGMDSWDIMDYGEYNGEGGTPAGFTSYERMYCGWLTPTELTEATEVQDMPSLTSEPVCYMLRNSGKQDEYFLFENRQQESWDSDLDGHGLLILHVDYDEQAWTDNTVNTIRSQQRMTIIPADNLLYSSTNPGDTWPGTSCKTELSDTSTPSGRFYNDNAEGNKQMNHTITGISESSDGHISFVFDEKALRVSRIFHEKKDEDFFDLCGRKCPVTTRGIYIQNGKKLMIR